MIESCNTAAILTNNFLFYKNEFTHDDNKFSKPIWLYEFIYYCTNRGIFNNYASPFDLVSFY